MSRRALPVDHNYTVDNCPPSVKAKVTTMIHAAMDYAFIGSQDPPRPRNNCSHIAGAQSRRS